jgi:epoxyqueuosine reductase
LKLATSDTDWLITKAREIGFLSCGVSSAGFLEDEAPRLEKWLKSSYNGQMGYMENHFDKRLDPTLLVDGAKTVISVLLNYFPEKKQNPNAPKLSKYAYGKDYHFVLKDKLRRLATAMEEKFGAFEVRAFVDSAPVLDKAWARRAGLGWMGKNTNLITPKAGSFYFIGELIVDLEFPSTKNEVKDFCGSCTRCIDACPTQAIVEPYLVDGSRCISYLTIELKDAIPTQFAGQMDDWMFGCDVCQDVCPWNRFSTPHQHPEFQPSNELLEMNYSDWEELTEETFRRVFRKSAVKRTKYSGLTRNITFLKMPPKSDPDNQ